MKNTVSTLARTDDSADEDVLSIPQDSSVVNAIEPYAQPQVLEDIFTPPPFLLARDVRSEAPSVSPASFAEPAPPAEQDLLAPATYSTPQQQPRTAESVAVTPLFQAPATAAEDVPAAAASASEAAPACEVAPANEVVAAPVAASVPAERVAPAPKLDNYAVGMRILRISPAWLLLSSVGFFFVIFLLSWLYQPATQTAGAAPAEAANHSANQTITASMPAVPEAETAVPTTTATQAAPPTDASTQAPAQSTAQAPTEATARAAVPASPSGGKFAVQVGSYSNSSEANERVSNLRAAGFEVRAVAAEIPQRGTWYRVYVGSFQTREEATRFGGGLRAKGVASASLVAEVK